MILKSPGKGQIVSMNSLHDITSARYKDNNVESNWLRRSIDNSVDGRCYYIATKRRAQEGTTSLQYYK
jgi:hypothetical protein